MAGWITGGEEEQAKDELRAGAQVSGQPWWH